MASKDIKCTGCGSTEIDYDPARGDAACVACGMVIQQSLIVNEVAFAEDGKGRSNMVGQHVGADGRAYGSKANGGGSVLPGHSPAATHNIMQNAKRHMFNLASQLKLSGGHVDQAVRLYRLAVERNFHRGRRVLNLSCACLYVVCRMERTPHMLLDFADVARTNVFTLGHTFLKLVRLLEITLPLVDPSLYMHRFAARLEFGDAHNAVAITALRIAARMQRDWMTQGRRPAGLCGAALLTAAVMHKFYRTQTEVASVVRIGNVVLRNRLRELDQTSTARMTVAQIEAGGGEDGKQTSLKLSGVDEKQCNPPAYNRNREKKKTEEVMKNKGTVMKRKRKAGMEPVEGDEQRKQREENEQSKQMAADTRVDKLMQEAMASDTMQALDAESEIAVKLSRDVEEDTEISKDAQNTAAQSSTQVRKRERRKGKVGEDGEPKDWEKGAEDGDDCNWSVEAQEKEGWRLEAQNEDLSDMSDDDAAKYISTEEEFKRKEELWMETNKEYIERQAYLERMKVENPAEYERIRPGSKRKRQSTTVTFKGQSERLAARKEQKAESAAGSGATQVRRSSKKINYQVLQSLEEGGDLEA